VEPDVSMTDDCYLAVSRPGRDRGKARLPRYGLPAKVRLACQGYGSPAKVRPACAGHRCTGRSHPHSFLMMLVLGAAPDSEVALPGAARS
jgi:hypothetical protein